MSEQKGVNEVSRRDVIRSGVVVGGGLLGTAIAGERVAAEDDDRTDIVGYVARSSYRKLSGADDVDCVPNVDGWGGSFYVERAAEDGDGETGVSVEVPDPSTSGGMCERCEAYTITADEGVELSGGPSGHGPWGEPCGSWLFVGDDATLETGAVYRVTEVYSTGPVGNPVESVTATDADGEAFGSPMELLPVALERVTPGQRWSQVEKLTRGGLDAGFGRAVAVEGPTAVVGADGEDAAYVFTLGTHGWTLETRLGDEVAVHGSEVAVDNGTVLVDAPHDSEGNDAVCVFTRSADGWGHQATLAPDDLDTDDGFGGAVAVDGETAVVGAAGAGDGGTVHVFTRSDGTWRRAATLEDGRTDVEDTARGLGYDVAVDGDTVVAGAPYTIAYERGYSDVGGGVVFTRSAGGWRQQAFLRSDDVTDGDRQGKSVAIANDTAVLASPNAHKGDASGDDAGAAWIYTRGESAWDQQAKLTPDGWDRRSWFGYSVSLDGDRLLAGADLYEGLGNDARGAAYLFTREGTDWSQLAMLTADDGDPYDRFGSDVALDGDTAFVCAVDDQGGNAATSGSTYVFQR